MKVARSNDRSTSIKKQLHTTDYGEKSRLCKHFVFPSARFWLILSKILSWKGNLLSNKAILWRHADLTLDTLEDSGVCPTSLKAKYPALNRKCSVADSSVRSCQVLPNYRLLSKDLSHLILQNIRRYFIAIS